MDLREDRFERRATSFLAEINLRTEIERDWIAAAKKKPGFCRHHSGNESRLRVAGETRRVVRHGKIAQMDLGPALQCVQTAEDRQPRGESAAHGHVFGERDGKVREIGRLDGKIEISLLVGIKRVEQAASLEDFRERKRKEKIAA